MYHTTHQLTHTAAHNLSQPKIHANIHAIHPAVTQTILHQFPVQSTASCLPFHVLTFISHCREPVKWNGLLFTHLHE
jgi:hypothetical protein